jgi:hypothetical protein
MLKEKGWSIVNDTPLPVICFTHEKIESGKITIKSILKKLYERNNVWISEAILQNKIHVLRACIINFRTKMNDLNILIDELEKIIKE